jgi:hypothetical protein
MNKPTNSPGKKEVLMPRPEWLPLFLLFICSPLFASNLRPTHDLSAALYPGPGEIEVEDTIRFHRETDACAHPARLARFALALDTLHPAAARDPAQRVGQRCSGGLLGKFGYSQSPATERDASL